MLTVELMIITDYLLLALILNQLTKTSPLQEGVA